MPLRKCGREREAEGIEAWRQRWAFLSHLGEALDSGLLKRVKERIDEDCLGSVDCHSLEQPPLGHFERLPCVPRTSHMPPAGRLSGKSALLLCD